MKHSGTISISIILLLSYCELHLRRGIAQEWNWRCISSVCHRSAAPTNVSVITSLNEEQEVLDAPQPLCNLVCGKYRALWPAPTGGFVAGLKIVPFDPEKIEFRLQIAGNEATKLFNLEKERFLFNIELDCQGKCSKKPNSTFNIYVKTDTPTLVGNWETNEGYSLSLSVNGSQITAKIDAPTFFGARHGLETLSQLISFSHTTNGNQLQRVLVVLSNVNISDAPVYRHRGLLLDTARNYLPVSSILRNIDGMAASKLNFLHWHATDSQSFPIVLPSLPEMSRYGAYSPEEVYTADDIKTIRQYALQRGVHLLLEIDSPAHAGNGWQWGESQGFGALAVCVNKQPWRKYCIQPPCGQLNPVNDKLYEIFEKILKDVVEMLPNQTAYHMGGDEVFIPCWNTTAEITDWLESQGAGRNLNDFLDLWGYFQDKMSKVLNRVVPSSSNKIILWTSRLTDIDVIEKYLNRNTYVIQTWVETSDPLPEMLLSLGYKIIISTKDAWYLDHGFRGNTQYHNWRKVYDNVLIENPGVLGGEVAVWSEVIDQYSVESRTWPRAAAAAERLWSNPSLSSMKVEGRFYRHRERLVQRGLQAESLAPGWCIENEFECQ